MKSRVKKITVALIALFLVTQAVFAVYANDGSEPAYMVEVRLTDISQREGSFVISGAMPVLSGISDKTFEKLLNDDISNLIKEKIRAAKKDSARGVTFSFESYQTAGFPTEDGMVSIVIYTETANASRTEEADSLHFNPVTCKMININDVLGINAVALINRYISDAIRQNPDQYNTGFRGVSETQDFYVEDGECVLLFDKYDVAPGYEGIVTFAMSIADILTTTVEKDEYVVLRDFYNLKMIPLRSVCEGLGYRVTWDSYAEAVVISKNRFSVRLTIGQNNYSPNGRELEAAPEVIDGVTYAPISFFGTLLGTAYTLDENDMVTFSQYDIK